MPTVEFDVPKSIPPEIGRMTCLAMIGLPAPLARGRDAYRRRARVSRPRRRLCLDRRGGLSRGGPRSRRRLPHPLDLLERTALGFGHGPPDPEPADEAEERKQPESGGGPDRA